MESELRRPAPAGCEHELFVGIALAKSLRARLDRLEVLLEQLPIEDVGARLRFFERDPVVEAGHEGEPSGAEIAKAASPRGEHLGVHHERDVDVHGVPDFDSMEPVLRDTDDRHWVSVDRQRTADDVARGSEPPLPETVSEDDNGVGTRHAIIVFGQEAASFRRHAERREVRSGHDGAAHTLSRAVRRQVKRRRIVREHRLEDFVAVAQSFEHRVRDGRVDVAVVVGRSRVRSGRIDHDEALGLAQRERPHQQLIDEGEDRGVRSNAECEGQHHRNGERGVLSKCANGEAEVLQEVRHGGSSFCETRAMPLTHGFQ